MLLELPHLNYILGRFKPSLESEMAWAKVKARALTYPDRKSEEVLVI